MPATWRWPGCLPVRPARDRRRARGIRCPLVLAVLSYDISDLVDLGQLDPVTTAILLGALLTSEAQVAGRNVGWGMGVWVKWVTVAFLPLEFFRERGTRRLWPFASLLLAGG